MKNYRTLLLTVGLATSLILSGCAMAMPGSEQPPTPTPPGAELPTGTLEMRVTDAPPRDEVTSIIFNVSAIEVHKAVAEQEQEQQQEGEGDQAQEQEQEQQQEQQGEGEWLPLNIIEEANPFDIVKLKESGLQEVLALDELEVGKYTQIRMTIESVEVTLGDGEPEEATLPSGELKFVRPFDIVEGETTVLLLDFDADKSVTVTGQGKVIVNPTVKLTVEGESSAGQPEEDEDAEELEFEGTIVDIEDSIWIMTIDGETMEVDVSGAEIDGEAAPELEAEVKGIVVDDVIIASEVEIKETEVE